MEDSLFNLAEFGERIRYLRKSLNMSQNQLSSSIGVTKGFISAVELGNRRLSIEYLCRLSNVLQVSTDELLMNKKCNETDVVYSSLRKASVLLHALNDDEIEFVISIMKIIVDKKEEKD